MSKEDLANYLETVSPGPIHDTERLSEVLRACWGDFSGSADESMAAHKLADRMERVVWEPPHLTFLIERHGGTVLGSSRAELQEWTVDLQSGSACCTAVGKRQIRPMKVRLDCGMLADEIVSLILDGKQDPRIAWKSDGSVKVDVGKIIPAESLARQTLAGRRKRFKTALEERLTEAGWDKQGRYLFRRRGEA